MLVVRGQGSSGGGSLEEVNGMAECCCLAHAPLQPYLWSRLGYFLAVPFGLALVVFWLYLICGLALVVFWLYLVCGLALVVFWLNLICGLALVGFWLYLIGGLALVVFWLYLICGLALGVFWLVAPGVPRVRAPEMRLRLSGSS